MATNTAFNLTIKVNGNEVKNTLNGVGKELRSLRNRTKNLTEGTDEWLEANKELAKTEKIYKDMKANQRELLDSQQAVTESTEDQAGAMSELSDNIGLMFTSLASGDLVGFQEGMQGVTGGIKSATRAAWAFIATPIGVAIAALAAIGASAVAVFKYNAALEELNEQLRALGVNAEELSSVRAGIQATAETFEKEFSEIAKKAKSLSESFGISMAEANDVIAKGLADGGKMNDEFLDSLGEYDEFFAKAGYSAQQFVDTINQGYELGIYTDKLPDAIKEATLSLTEQTTATKDALVNAFGAAFTDELLQKIDVGETSVREGLEAIAVQAEKTGLTQQQQAQLTADIFRGAGEDAGGALKVLEAVAQAAQRELSETAKAEIELQEANERLNEAQANLWEIAGFGELWITIKTKVVNAIATLLEIFGLMKIQGAIVATEVTNFFIGMANATIGAVQNLVEQISPVLKAIGVDVDNLQAKLNNFKMDDVNFLVNMTSAPDETASGPTDAEIKAATEKAAADKKAQEEAQKRAEERAAKIKAREKEVTEFLAEQNRQRTLDAMEANEREMALIDEKYAKLREKAAENEDLLKELEAEKKKEKAEARAKQEEEEMERLAAFEERKKEFYNELELQKAESDEEKEEIKKEQELEKEEAAYDKKVEDFEAEMEWLNMTEAQKNALLEDLKESHEAKKLAIQQKYTDQQIANEQKMTSAKKKLMDDTLNASINLFGSQSKLGQALLIMKQVMAAKEMAISLGLFQSKMALNVAEATGDTAKGLAKTTSAAPFPANIPLIIGFAAQVVGIISAISSAASKGNSVKKTFARGGYTDLFGTGRFDETGHEVAGIVHTGEYVVPSIVRQDPEVPQILDYLEKKRRNKLGLYASGGDVAGGMQSTRSNSSTTRSDSMFIDIMERLLIRLETPLQSQILFGPEAEIARMEQQKKIEKIQRNAQVKK